MCFAMLAAALPSIFGTTAAATGTVAASTAAAAATAGLEFGTLAAAAPAAATGLSWGTIGQIASLAGTGLQAISAYNQAQVANQVAENNAKIAEYQAQDALKRGEQQSMDIRRKAAAYKSTQRSMMGARGLDLTYGSAADILDQTDFFSETDVATTRTNAANEAWARRAQATNYRAEAASRSPWMMAGGTLLAGAGQVANKWYQYSNPGANWAYQTAKGY